MDDLNLLSKDDVTEDGEEGEDSRKGRFSVDDQKRYMVHLQAVCEIPDACSTSIGMRDDNDVVATINELGGKLVDVTLDTTRLWEEEVADHCNVVRHDELASLPIW